MAGMAREPVPVCTAHFQVRQNAYTVMIRAIFTFIITAFTAAGAWAAAMKSPDGHLLLKQEGAGYAVYSRGEAVVSIPEVGIAVGDGGAWTYSKQLKPKSIKESYRMLSGKKSVCTNAAREYAFLYHNAAGKELRLVFRLYNDGVAFRYELSGLQNEKIRGEQTVYHIAEGTKRWMQKFDDSYENFFPLSVTGASSNHHWGYPALLQVQRDVWVLLTEAGIERRQSASSLKNDAEPDRYRVSMARNELELSGEWHSPWRVAIVGSLADVVASTLVTDVSAPCRLGDTSWIRPGVASWIYWAYNRGSKDFRIVKQYIDMAAALQLPYVLIDWEWDIMGNGGTIDDALEYAARRGVKVLLWYNSSTAWTTNGAGGPLFKLNAPDDREREFAMLEEKGVAGVKIDFFSGDTQPTMDYCIDLLECAARHRLLVNFHGATIPRGWQRTYPNLLTVEAVYGAEWYNNAPLLTNRAAAHNATLPFTRNVIGAMDYTPCTFSDSQHPHITTNAHELALTVLFESGLQHLADKPESYLAQPQEVQCFLSGLPAAWDETRLVTGYPGEEAVIARRKDDTWYVAGINGTDSEREIITELSFLGRGTWRLVSFFDGDDGQQPWLIADVPEASLPSSVRCRPRGGFVLKLRKN